MKKYIVTLFDEKNRPSYELRKVKVTEDVEDTNWGEGDKLVDYHFVQTRMNHLLGEVLTLIDASIHESRQNKAMKDLIKRTFIEEYCHLSEMLTDKEKLDELSTVDDESDIEEVDMDKALGLK